MSTIRMRAILVALVVVAAASLAGRASAVPPGNDSFAAALELTGRDTSASGTNKDATKEAGEPAHAADPGGASVWYRWTAPANGETTVSTCDSAFDTLLAVYTGAAVNALAEVTSNDDACGFQSSVSFTATEGTTYRIAVDGNDGVTGLIELRLRLAPPNDDFADAEELIGDVGSVNGTNVGASFEPSEPGDVSGSVWYRWTAPSSGPATFTTCGAPFDTAIAVYTGSVLSGLSFVTYSDDACGVGSSASFEAAAGTTYNIAVGGCCGGAGDFTLAWNRNPGPPSLMDYPSISGTARAGQTLTGSPGQWTGSPNFAFAWGRCDAPVDECDLIPGATGQTYTITSADVGNRLFLQVTATNAGGSSLGYSDVTLIVRPSGPTNTALPEVFGRTVVGNTLDATTGTWTGVQPISYAYQWQQCNSDGNACHDISGAQSSTLQVGGAQLGSTVRVIVTASNLDGPAAAASSPSDIVIREQTQPRRCVVPNVRGKTLSAARKAIRQARCRVGRIERRFSSRAKAGRVMAQAPRAGRRLPVGTRVNLVVSKGKRR